MIQRGAVVGCIAVAAVLVVGAVPSLAQDEAPRTAWGQPDLQGVWDFRSITPMQRPEDLADQAFLTAVHPEPGTGFVAA